MIWGNESLLTTIIIIIIIINKSNNYKYKQVMTMITINNKVITIYILIN